MSKQGGPSNPVDEIQRQFGALLPPWLVAILTYILVGLAILKLIQPLWSKVKPVILWAQNRRRVQDRHRARLRSRFADHIESQLRRLDEKEEWRDGRYSELEAEIEIVSARRRGPIQIFRQRGSGVIIRRTTSLSTALEVSNERLILLEGPPGAGKSVTLRHTAQRLAKRAMSKPSESTTIPLYVNLKSLKIPPSGPVNAKAISDFILNTLNSTNSSDISRFLEEEFPKGQEEGGWLFIFDSFDEIPAILAAADARAEIEQYADALYDFLHGMNRCRGIVASRQFRGPSELGWPRFRILPLSKRRQQRLIRNAEIGDELTAQLTTEVLAGKGLPELAENPMFLGLICEHVRVTGQIPGNMQGVMESFVHTRLERDAARLWERYATSLDEVRLVAEDAAFCMTLPALDGLSPKTSQLAEAILSISPDQSAEVVNAALDGLVYCKLAKHEDDSRSSSASDTTFTFSHRRVQEYFATCTVLKHASRVSIPTLLLDGRWRESVVTLLQTQQYEKSVDLIRFASRQLAQTTVLVAPGWSWPTRLYNLLEIFAQGLPQSREDEATTEFRTRAGQLLASISAEGSRLDQRWCLELSSAADSTTMAALLAAAFKANSQWLHEEAFEQARSLGEDAYSALSIHIRQSLIDLSVGGQLRRDRWTIEAQLRRVREPRKLLEYVKLLLLAPIAEGMASLLFLATGLLSGVAANQALGVFGMLGLLQLIAPLVLPTVLASESRRGAYANQLGIGRWAPAAGGAALLFLFTTVLLSRVFLVLGSNAIYLSIPALAFSAWSISALIGVRIGISKMPSIILPALPVIVVIKLIPRLFAALAGIGKVLLLASLAAALVIASGIVPVVILIFGAVLLGTLVVAVPLGTFGLYKILRDWKLLLGVNYSLEVDAESRMAALLCKVSTHYGLSRVLSELEGLAPGQLEPSAGVLLEYAEWRVFAITSTSKRMTEGWQERWREELRGDQSTDALVAMTAAIRAYAQAAKHSNESLAAAFENSRLSTFESERRLFRCRDTDLLDRIFRILEPALRVRNETQRA